MQRKTKTTSQLTALSRVYTITLSCDDFPKTAVYDDFPKTAVYVFRGGIKVEDVRRASGYGSGEKRKTLGIGNLGSDYSLKLL